MGKGGFRGLLVWHKAKELAIVVNLTREQARELIEACEEMGRMLRGLISARSFTNL
jgi:hypothetical protein